MRFREGMKGVTPLLTALPPESTLSRPEGTHSSNPAVREAIKRGEPQLVTWAGERPDGGVASTITPEDLKARFSGKITSATRLAVGLRRP